MNHPLDRDPGRRRLRPVSDLSQNPTTPISGSLSDLSALGPAFAAGSMCDLLGIEPEQLGVMVADLAVLQVVTADDVPVFPAFQVGDDGRLLAGLGDVLCELAGGVDDPWTWWIWLASRPGRLGGRAMWELLRDGDTQAVVQSAGRAAWAWRQ